MKLPIADPEVEARILEWFDKYQKAIYDGLKVWVESLKNKYGVITKDILEKEVDNFVNSTDIRGRLESSSVLYTFDEFIVDFAEYIAMKYTNFDILELVKGINYIFLHPDVIDLLGFGADVVLSSYITYGFFKELFTGHLEHNDVLDVFIKIYKKYT